uniref:Tudor domain containing 15 n=1 Tax=Sparus aurata TaxID=8175 RepID=A0A671V508_SPAAU
HLDWNPEATLIHFQGQYLTICELDYNIMQGEIQNIPKSKAAVNIGEFCLVEDLASARWYRGRVQNRRADLFDVFLIDHGNVLSVDIANISSGSSDLFILPPKIVCGFLANVLLLEGCPHSVGEEYLSSLIGRNVMGYIQALLPHKVLLLETPEINNEFVRHGFGRHVDTDTFLLLVEMLAEVPLKQNVEPVPDLLIEKPWGQEYCFKPSLRVTAAVKPELFYCQMASMQTDLSEMSQMLAAVCEHKTKERSQKTPENLGLLCSVKGKDGKWYRGLVQFLPVSSHVRVLLIDYGFFESVKVENVHRLPPDFVSKPIMAFPCSLCALNDQDEAVKAQQLSFLKAGLLGRTLDVEIRSFDEEQHLYSITLIDAEDTKPTQELPKVNFESVFKTKELSPQGGYLYHETVMSEALGKTLEAEEVQVGSVFVGYVEHVQNPQRFWIRTQKRNADFEEMMTKMMDHFSQVKLEEDTLLNPELGTLCCALYEEDMHFYRGVVTDTLEHGAEVLFIDFGNTEKVPYMLIKKIPEEFASKSAFAFCCSLVNVFPLDEVWTSTTCAFFRRAVSNKALLVHVVQMSKNKFVQLKDYEEEDKTCKTETERAKAPAHFKVLNTKPGFEFAVHCSYINSPSDFWCQPLDKVPALEELMDKVQQYYTTHTVPLKLGDLCCVAKSPQDGRWYRAFITEKQKGHARVILLDYGYTIQVQDHNLQAIMPEYVYLEGQAFRCSLYNLIEPADPKNCGNWSPEVCKSLSDFVRNSTCGLRCKVVSQLNVKNKGLCNVVDLYNTQTQQSITNQLLKQGLAREVTISTKQQALVFPESFVFSSYDLNLGSEEKVYITHISSQWEVYCHLERNTDIIEELEKRILEESEKMMQASRRAVVRKMCLAKYLDGKWYRGLAHPVQSPLHLNVFFVDYGNTNISEKTHVMFIPRDSTDLLYTPMQAVRCSLASVSKDEHYTDVKKWLGDAVLNKQVKALIVGKNEDGSFDVELFDGEVNVNEKVKELILSFSPKPKTDLSFVMIKSRSHLQGHSPNSATSKNQRRTQVGSEPRKKKENDNTKSCVHEKPAKNSPVKQQREYRDTNTKSEQPQCTEKVEISQLSCLLDMKVTKGLRAMCFVSHIDSVNSFFLQLSEDEAAILKMAEDLNSGTFGDSIKTTKPVRINDLVLAEYEEDSALYRSMVKDCEGSSCFRVEFVDYGNSAVMGKDKLYTIPKEYLSQPRFSIPCSLLDTSTYQNDASFTDAVMEQPLMVDFVRQYHSHWEVKVEILGGARGLPPLPEAAVERGMDTKKEEEALASSAAIEKGVRSCEQNYQKKEVSENEMSKFKRKYPIAVAEKVVLKPLLATLLPKRTLTRRGRRRTPARNMDAFKKNERKTVKYSVKARSDCADTIIPTTIQAKDTENCTILSVLGNGSFYVRLNRTSKLFSALENGIADNLHKCEMVAEEDVKQDLKCLVQVHRDKQWHRAVVQHVHHGKCQVHLMDHGSVEEIPICSIRQQCSNLRKIPNLAVLCEANCFGFSEEKGAHNVLCETLKPMIGKEVKLVFVCYSEAEKLWKVEMITNRMFLKHQIAASLQKNEEMYPSPAEIRNEKADRKSISETSQPQQLVFAPVDIDKAYSGFAAAVTTPFEFCVVLEDSLLVMTKVSMMLDDLSKQLSPLPEAHLVPGTCCLLKSDTKSKWCRAEIIQSNTTAILNLVDYGLYECIPYENCSNLRKLPVEIMNLPKVTYPCILRGVKPIRADGQWTDEAAVFFQQCLYQKNLQIFFREFVSNTHWKVDILADDVHVAKELVDAGHAGYIDIMLGLRYALITLH